MNPPPAAITLFSGAEPLLISRGQQALKRQLLDYDPTAVVIQTQAADYQAGTLDQNVAPSLFGAATLIEVLDLQTAGADLITELTQLLTQALPPDRFLSLMHTGGTRGKSAVSAAKAAGAKVVNCAPITRDNDKVAFVSTEFANHNCQVSPLAARFLVDALGTDLQELAAICDQIATDLQLLHPQIRIRVDLEQVEAFTSARHSVTGFKVADAVAAGNRELTLTRYRQARSAGVDPVPLLAAVGLKFRTLAKVSMHSGGSQQIAARTGLAPWQVDRARRELGGWSQTGIGQAMQILAQADAEVKGGSKDADYAAERAVLQLCLARNS